MIKILGCHSSVTQSSFCTATQLLHNNEQQKTKDIMVIFVPSFDTIRCELKKTKYIQNSIHSNELSSATTKGRVHS